MWLRFLGFPLALLIIFGSIPSFTRPRASLGGLTELDLYVPILIAFVIAMLALNALPPVLAGYREKGILRRLRTTPVGPARVLAAQLVAIEHFVADGGGKVLAQEAAQVRGVLRQNINFVRVCHARLEAEAPQRAERVRR